MSLTYLNFVNIVVLTLRVKKRVNIDVLTVAWCFTETIQFLLLVLCFFSYLLSTDWFLYLLNCPWQIWTICSI